MADALAWIDFLNANGRPLEQALGRRLEQSDAPDRALVLCADPERAAALNAGLWTYDAASFLAHGGEGDGAASDHPVWIADTERNPSDGAVIVVDDAEPQDWDVYAGRMYLFDAQDPIARDAARSRWRVWSEAGKSLAYWSFDGAVWALERHG
jgi:DNA polymerase-3 subunit chi